MKLDLTASASTLSLDSFDTQLEEHSKLQDIEKAELVASLLDISKDSKNLRVQASNNDDVLKGIGGGGGLFDGMEEPDESMYQHAVDASIPTEDLFALTMGDFMISGSDLEGANPSATVGEMNRRLVAIDKTANKDLFVEEIKDVRKEIAVLQQNFEQMKKLTLAQESAARKQNNFISIQPDETAAALALKTADELRQLKPGELCLLPGGWAGGYMNGINGSGHFIGYAIQKQQDGQFEFMPVNTGYGISAYHGYIESAAGNKDLYATDISIRNIPESVICGQKDKSAAFLTALMELKMGRLEVVQDHFTKHTRSLDDAVKTVYELIWKLGGKTATLSQYEKDYQTPQRAGTCTWKPLKTILNLKLGLPTSERVILESDMQSLQHHLGHWQKVLDKDPTKRVLLIEINKKMARRAVKLLQNNTISFATCQKVYKQLLANKKILEPYYQDLNATPGPLLAKANEQINAVEKAWDKLIISKGNLQDAEMKESLPAPKAITLKKCDTAAHIHGNIKDLNALLDQVLPRAQKQPQIAEAALRQIQYFYNALPAVNIDDTLKDFSKTNPRQMNRDLLNLYENYIKLCARTENVAGAKALISAQTLTYMHAIAIKDYPELKDTSIPALKRVIDIALHTPTYVPDAQELKTLYQLRQHSQTLLTTKKIPLASKISMEQNLFADTSRKPDEALKTLGTPEEISFYEKLLQKHPELKKNCRTKNDFFKDQSEAVKHMADLMLVMQHDQQPSKAGGLMPDELASLTALKRAIKLASLTSTHDVDLFKVEGHKGELLSDSQMQLTGTPIQVVRYIIGNKPVTTHFYKKSFKDTPYQFKDDTLKLISMGPDKSYTQHNDFENLFEEYQPQSFNKNENQLQISHPNQKAVNQYLHLKRLNSQNALTHTMALNFYLENITLLSNPDHQHSLELALLRSKPDTHKPEQGYITSELQLNGENFTSRTSELLLSAGLYFNDKNDIQAVLFIARLAQLCEAHFKQQGLDLPQSQQFTDLLIKVKKEASLTETASINALLSIKLANEKATVSNLSTVIRYGFNAVYFKENGSKMHGLIEPQLFKTLFKMQPYFQNLAKSDAMKDTLAQVLQNLKLKATGKEKISGQWPLLQFGEYTFDFNRFTVSREHIDLHMQLPSTLTAMPVFKQLIQNPSLGFDVNDRIYTFRNEKTSFDLTKDEPVITRRFKIDKDEKEFRLIQNLSQNFKDKFGFIGHDYLIWINDSQMLATHKATADILQLTTIENKTKVLQGKLQLADLSKTPEFMTHLEKPEHIRAWYQQNQLQKLELTRFDETFSLKDGDSTRLRWDKDIRYVLNTEPSPLFGHFRQFIELVNADNPQDRVVLIPEGKPVSVRNRNDSGREPSEIIIQSKTRRALLHPDNTPNVRGSKSMLAIKMNPRGQLLAQTPEEHLALASIAYRLHHYKDALSHINKSISETPFTSNSISVILQMFKPISTGLDLNAATGTLGMSNNHPNAFAFRLQLVAALAQNGIEKPDEQIKEILTHYSLKTKIELSRYVETINNVDAGLRLTTQQLHIFKTLDNKLDLGDLKIVSGKSKRFIDELPGNNKIQTALKKLKQSESDKVIKEKDAVKVQQADYGLHAFPETLPMPKKGPINLLTERKPIDKTEWLSRLRSLSVLSPSQTELQKLASSLIWIVNDLNSDDKDEVSDRMKFYSFAFDDDINYHKLYLTTAISSIVQDTAEFNRIIPANLKKELDTLEPPPAVAQNQSFGDALSALNAIKEANLFGFDSAPNSDFDAMSLTMDGIEQEGDRDTVMVDAPATSSDDKEKKAEQYRQRIKDKTQELHDFYSAHFEKHLKIEPIQLVKVPDNAILQQKNQAPKFKSMQNAVTLAPVVLSEYVKNPIFNQEIFQSKFNPLASVAGNFSSQSTSQKKPLNSNQIPRSFNKTTQEQIDILRAAIEQPQLQTAYNLSQNIDQLKAALEAQFTSQTELDNMQTSILDRVNSSADPASNLVHQLNLTGRSLSSIDFTLIKARLAQHWLHQLTQINPLLNQAQLGEAGLMTITMLNAQAKNKTIQRILDLIEQASTAQGPQQHTLIQSIGALLNAKRHYNPLENPEYLIFEAEAGILLREEQVQILDQLNHRSVSQDTAEVANLITQLAMGSGKTKVLLPILAMKNANGINLSAITVLQPLMAINAAEVTESTVNAFEQFSHTFEFNRQTKISTDTLTALNQDLENMIQNREYLITTPEAIQCFSLRYIELMKMRHEKQDVKVQKELDTQLDLMNGILNKFKNQGINLIDEADTILNPLYEVNYSIGHEQNLDAEHIQLMTDIYKILVTTPKFEDLLGLRLNQQAQTSTGDISKLMHNVAAKALALPQFKNVIDGKYLKELQQYISSVAFNQDRITKSLAASSNPAKRKAAELLEMLRLQLTQILPLTLSHSAGVSYGIDEMNHIYQSIPHNHGQPQTQSRFGHVLMTGHYTLQHYLHEAFGIPESLVQSTLESLSSSILNTARLNKINTAETTAFKNLAALLNRVNVKVTSMADIKPQSPAFIQAAAKALNKNPEAILEFVKNNVMNTIGYYPERITSTAQDIVSLFGYTHGFSGTMTHSDTYHQSLQRQLSPETYQLVYGILTDPKVSQIMTSITDTPEAMMKEIAATPDFRKVSAIIDTGALFKNLTPARVADGLAKEAGNNDVKKAITYFNQKNKLVLKNLKSRQENILPDTSETTFKASGYTSKERLDFYDQAHAIGVDIPRESDEIAYITIGADTTFSDMAQGILRMRKLLEGQQIKVLVPTETAALILKNAATAGINSPWIKEKKITTEAILWHTYHNQGMELEKEKVLSIRHKVKNMITSEIMQAATVTDHQVRADLYSFFENFLIDQLQHLNQEFKMSSQIRIDIALQDFFNETRASLESMNKKNTFQGASRQAIDKVLADALAALTPEKQSFMITTLGALPEMTTGKIGHTLENKVQIQTEDQIAESKMELKTATQQQENTNNEEKPADIKKWPFETENTSIYDFDFKPEENIKAAELKSTNDIVDLKNLFPSETMVSESNFKDSNGNSVPVFIEQDVNQPLKSMNYLLVINDDKAGTICRLALHSTDITALKKSLEKQKQDNTSMKYKLINQSDKIEYSSSSNLLMPEIELQNIDILKHINKRNERIQIKRLTDLETTKGLFRPDLLASENLIKTLFSESVSLSGSNAIDRFQKPADHMLISINRKTNKTSGIVLSLTDTNAFKAALNTGSTKKDKADMMLIDKMGNITHKGNTQFKQSLIDKNPAIQMLVTQMKVLNAPVLHRLELNLIQQKCLDAWLKEGTADMRASKNLLVKSFMA